MRTSTWVLGESTVSLMEIESTGELYVYNFITVPEHRGQGHAHRLMDALLATADGAGATLVTHPEDDQVQAWFERHGFVYAPDRGRWKDKPFLIRAPGTMEPPETQE
jgi:ribosomal protein S18 acetylase RimI-like enzyme